MSTYRSDKYLVNAVINGIEAHPDLQNDEAYAELEDNLQRTIFGMLPTFQFIYNRGKLDNEILNQILFTFMLIPILIINMSRIELNK